VNEQENEIGAVIFNDFCLGKPVFTRDSKSVAYRAKKGEKWFLVLDGSPGPEYDGVLANGPTLRPDTTLEYLGFKQGAVYRVKHIPQTPGVIHKEFSSSH
jgi:hypothetical protein